MHQFEINGGARLAGKLKVDGSKNAALPLMAASLLADYTLTLQNVPELSDIDKMVRLLGELGVSAALVKLEATQLQKQVKVHTTIRYLPGENDRKQCELAEQDQPDKTKTEKTKKTKQKQCELAEPDPNDKTQKNSVN